MEVRFGPRIQSPDGNVDGSSASRLSPAPSVPSLTERPLVQFAQTKFHSQEISFARHERVRVVHLEEIHGARGAKFLPVPPRVANAAIETTRHVHRIWNLNHPLFVICGQLSDGPAIREQGVDFYIAAT